MKIAVDPVPIGQPTGNSVYTTELLGALLRGYPDCHVELGARLHKRGRAVRRFGGFPNFSCDSWFVNPRTFRRYVGAWAGRRASAHNDRRLISLGKRADLLHLTDPMNFVPGLGPYVVTLLDLISLRAEPWVSAPTHAFYKANTGRILAGSRAVFTISEYTKTECVRLFPETEPKITVTPLAASPLYTRCPTAPSALERLLPAAPGARFILYVGEFQPRKNVLGICAAFAGLSPALRNGVRLVLVGGRRKRRAYYPQVMTEAERLGIAHRVTTLTHASDQDLLALYNAATCFVFPSFHEGFGLPVLEAMSCGCPVITSNVSSLPEVAGRAGMLVDPNDTAALTTAMEQVLGSERRREEMSEAGLRQARRFEWSTTAQLTYQGYRAALNA